MTDAVPPPTDRPLYWLVVLDLAIEHGDHQAAADAQRQLERLGVRIAYGRPRFPIAPSDANTEQQEAADVGS